MGGPGLYGVTKAALNALTIRLSKELPSTVKVNAMCPGWVRTRSLRVASAIGICDPAVVQPFSTSSRLTLAMIAITARCGACSVVYPSVQVGPNFRVKVEDHGRPVKGLRVEIGSYPGSGNS